MVIVCLVRLSEKAALCTRGRLITYQLVPAGVGFSLCVSIAGMPFCVAKGWLFSSSIN